MILDENLIETKSDIKLSDKEIFTQIWTSPRLVLRYINDNKYDKFVTILLVLAGISKAFDQAISKNLGDNMSLIALIGICIVSGGLLGWVFYYIFAAMISWTGTWLNGTGNTKSMLRVVAHSSIPAIVSMIFLIPEIVLYRNGNFQSTFDINTSETNLIIIFYSILFLKICLLIWSMVIMVAGISEVQKFSIGKSLLNMFLPVFMFVTTIIIIALIINIFDVTRSFN